MQKFLAHGGHRACRGRWEQALRQKALWRGGDWRVIGLLSGGPHWVSPKGSKYCRKRHFVTWIKCFSIVHTTGSVQFSARKQRLIIAHRPNRFPQLLERFTHRDPRFQQQYMFTNMFLTVDRTHNTQFQPKVSEIRLFTNSLRKRRPPCWLRAQISFYCVIPYSEYREKNNMVLLKSYEAVTAMAVALVAPPVNER